MSPLKRFMQINMQEPHMALSPQRQAGKNPGVYTSAEGNIIMPERRGHTQSVIRVKGSQDTHIDLKTGFGPRPERGQVTK